jgi:protein SCO1/2
MTAQERQHLLWGTILLALVGLAAAAWLTSPQGRQATSGARVVVQTEDTASPLGELQDYGAVPDFSLVCQTGAPIRRVDLDGNVWIGDFIFTNCASSCPMMTSQLQKLETALRDVPSVRLVSFSVDPERDTAERLAEYAREYGAVPERWLFLTGDKTALRKLSIDGFHLPAGDATPEEVARGAEAVLHSTRFVLVDSRGHIRGYYDGADDAAMEKLRSHVRRLAAETAS